MSSSVTPSPLTTCEILQALSTGVQAAAGLRSFTYEELDAATMNFMAESMLGEGGFGKVFKGYIDPTTFAPASSATGVPIAVKKLNEGAHQGHKEWVAEVKYLGTLLHPNLVKLIGHCDQDGQHLLVYEFMPNGSLESHLFRGSLTVPPLLWDVRLNIALGAAEGLKFLHNNMAPVIHRDFKTANILLDLSYNAKLSDFGLARDGPTGDKSHVSASVMGTYGYAAPEYVRTGHLTMKCDVYSYGVVLLETLSGRRALDRNRPPGERNLVDWARPYLKSKRRISDIMDPLLGGQYPLGAAQKAAALVRKCISVHPKARPGMEKVVAALEKLLNDKETVESGQGKVSGGSACGLFRMCGGVRQQL